MFSALSALAKLRYVISFALLAMLQVVAWWKVPWTRKWIVLANLTLLPVAQIVPTLHFRADRYLYLPSLAFAGALVEGGAALVRVRASSGPARLRLGAKAVVALAAGYAALVWQRVPHLENDETLFRYEIAGTPDYREGLAILGSHYDRMGRHELAEPLLQKALDSVPARISYVDWEGVVLVRSFNLLALDRPRAAYEFIASYREGVRRAENARELNYNLAVAAFRLERYDEALPLLQQYRAARPKQRLSTFME